MARGRLFARTGPTSLLTALVLAVAAIPAAAQQPAGQAGAAKAPAAPKQAVSPLTPPAGGALVWYLGLCGYAVRTQDHLLIFDYQEKYGGAVNEHPADQTALASGWVVPDEIKDLKVRVFAANSNSDHYDPVINTWRQVIPDIEYFFGFKSAEGISAHTFVGPRAELTLGGLTIATINGHLKEVPRVAWLVKVDGLVIYHDGDCEQRNPPSEHDFLRTKSSRIDLAFGAPAIRLDGKAMPEALDFVRKFEIGASFPMHGVPGEGFLEAMRANFPGLRVSVPTAMGERFVYAKGRVVSSSGGVPTTNKKGTRS